MIPVKREAHCPPETEQKRRCKGVPSRKVNFGHNSADVLATADHTKGREVHKNTGLKVRRSKRSKRWTSNSSCSESEFLAVEKEGPKLDVPWTGLDASSDVERQEKALLLSEHRNCCSTPVLKRGHDLLDCVPVVSESILEREQSARRYAITPLVKGCEGQANNFSFSDDDVALASLDLSEIIKSSGTALNTAGEGNGPNSGQVTSNQFYGLPMKVTELLRKIKGIETLYGECLHFYYLLEICSFTISKGAGGGAGGH